MHRYSIPAFVMLTLGVTGCHFKGGVATFPGVENPVLLSQKDRIGGDAPLETTKLKEFEAEAEWSFTQSTETNALGQKVRVETEEWTKKDTLAKEAKAAIGRDENVDIRLTDVMPAAYVVLFGMKNKAYVSVEGDVVKVNGQAGGKK